jgi:alkanesulfonate monooxygenase SsuD/methylene tetrahydromethanopterin reductase-like flavin-dependent oxidoreductase (luciferase family)
VVTSWVALSGEWRARAEAGNLSAREVVIEVTGRQSFIGSAETTATTIKDLVQADAADGYILVPHITPGGLTPFVDRVSRCCRSAGCSAPTTPAPRCATTSAWAS